MASLYSVGYDNIECNMAILEVETSSIALTAFLISINVAPPVESKIDLFLQATFLIKGILVKSEEEIL